MNTDLDGCQEDTETETECTIPDLNDELLQTPDAERDIFEYIVGAICWKFKLCSPDDIKEKNSWICIKGEKKLIQPSEDIVDICRKTNELFDIFNGQSLKRCLDPIGSVIRLVLRKHPAFDMKIVKYFVRMKFFSRVKRKNIDLKLKKSTNVRVFKQTAQFVN